MRFKGAAAAAIQGGGRGHMDFPSNGKHGRHTLLETTRVQWHYRVGHLLADLGWVDLDMGSSKAGGPLL